jgi:hypothetical protein
MAVELTCMRAARADFPVGTSTRHGSDPLPETARARTIPVAGLSGKSEESNEENSDLRGADWIVGCSGGEPNDRRVE